MHVAVVQFFRGCFAQVKNFHVEMQFFASEGVVEVQFDHGFGQGYNCGINQFIIFVIHFQLKARLEGNIIREFTAGQENDILRITLAITILRQDKEGFISYIDRKKDLIISGGENIFPVDLEAVLIGQPKVKDVAIIGIPDERYGEVVAAVVQPKEGVDLSEAEMRAYYEPQLPKYAWPRLILFGDVPRNPTGKIEKPKLRDKYADVRWNPKG